MKTRYFLTVPVSGLVVAFAVACSSSGSSGYGGSSAATTAPPPASSAPVAAASTPTSSGGGAAASTMDIKDFMFTTLTVSPGTKITVTNQDSAPHTATIKTANVDVSVAPGASGTFSAPTTPGTYSLTCDVHPSMHGTLIVK